jgi:hypothetical protein
MENLLGREISHHFVQNLYELAARFLFFTETLKLALRLAESGAQCLDLVVGP